MKPFLSLVALSCTVLALSACGGRDEPEPPEPRAEDPPTVQPIRPIGTDEAPVSQETEEVTVEAPAEEPSDSSPATTFDTSLDLPAAFPNDIVLPQAWTIIGTTPVPDGFSVQAMSENGVGEAADQIRSAMERQGWTATDAGTLSEQVSQLGFEKDGRTAKFNIIDSGGKATVQLVTMTKPE